LTKAALNSSVIIALSATGHIDKLGNVAEIDYEDTILESNETNNVEQTTLEV